MEIQQVPRKPKFNSFKTLMIFIIFLVAVIFVIVKLMKYATKEAMSLSRPTPASYDPTRVCDDALGKDIDQRSFPGSFFEVPLTEGCFGPLVTLPNYWQDKLIHLQMNPRTNECWAAIWPAGMPKPTTLMWPKDDVNFPAHIDAFRLQGHQGCSMRLWVDAPGEKKTP